MTCTAAFARVVLACGALACAGEASGQVLTVTVTTSDVGAEWSFNTRTPATMDGGEISFLAVTRAALVPVVGRFWKLADGNGDAAMVYCKDFSGAAWELGEGADVPRDGPARAYHREGTHTP